MKLLYDARLISEPFSGLGRFTGALLQALLEHHPWNRHELTVLVPASAAPANNPYVSILEQKARSSPRVRILRTATPGISLQQHFNMPAFVEELAPDNYFYPHFDAPMPRGVPLSFVVHDLQPLLVTDYVQRVAWLKKAYFRWRLSRNLAGAHRCLAVSAQTKSDLCNTFGMRFENKINICWEGDYLSNIEPDPKERLRLGIRRPYLIYVGSRRPNKNLAYTIDVVQRMRSHHGYPGDLLIVGSGENYGFDLDRYAGRYPWIHLLRDCNDLALASLYQAADALILLSRYEGFGLPVLEASRFGLPLILSDGGALPEIAPSHACILPLSLKPSEAARRASEYLLRAANIKLPQHDDRYSWQKTAQICFPEIFHPNEQKEPTPNYDYPTIHSFGREWQRFAQDPLKADELSFLGRKYFGLLPQKYLNSKKVACDFGCGSGRWARLIAPRVKTLHCIDASLEVLRVARRNLSNHENVRFHCCSLEEFALGDDELDFAYCLGVLHHLPDPAKGLAACVKKLKPGAPILLYIYQKIEKTPAWRRRFFTLVNVLRKLICRMPGPYVDVACDLLAFLVYLPLARLARLAESLGADYRFLPLAFYRNSSFYTMRTDARDRFGTPLEKRYSKDEVVTMMRKCGLEKIRFSNQPPYWTAMGFRKR